MATRNGHLTLGLAIAAGLLAAPASAADFPTVVAQILSSQTTGALAKMDPARKQEMIACVNGVVAGMPAGRRREIAAAPTLDEQEHLFGVAVMENRAEWKQKIAAACAKIALKGGS